MSKNEEISARIYGTNDITENFVTECLLKEETLLNQYGENPAGKWYMDGWMDKIYHPKKRANTIHLRSAVYQHTKKP